MLYGLTEAVKACEEVCTLLVGRYLLKDKRREKSSRIRSKELDKRKAVLF